MSNPVEFIKGPLNEKHIKNVEKKTLMSIQADVWLQPSM